MGRLLVGLTGGIATGKTIVAKMFEDLGASIIDYDVLSRMVVAPGKPALKDIVSFFGESVLNADQSLNRQKMREIVFPDAEKRKKLEGFIHPRLNDLFYEQVDQIVSKDQNAIIQAVIPLLIETSRQSMFDCVIMVYAPRNIQLQRLMVRDKNDAELAAAIIDAQMSVEEKKKRCDFVIDNAGSLAVTKEQVDKVWQKLNEIQKTLTVNL